MQRLRHLAIFLPCTNPFYLGLLVGMKRGFEAVGVTVSGWTELPDEVSYLEFVRLVKPDAILEMNRTRRQRPYLPREVGHISWMVDSAEWPYDQLGDSELIYFIGRHWADRFRARSQGFVDWLPPGTDPVAYAFGQAEPISRFGFAGHIPKPWTAEQEARVVASTPQGNLDFGRLFRWCCERWRVPPAGFDNECYLADALAAAAARLGVPVELADPRLRYDISCRTVRLINRTWLADTVLEVSPSFRLGGPPNWPLYPRYAPHYIGPLHGAQALGDFYRTSQFNLHEGVGPHFRVFDCLAAGGLLFCRRAADNDLPGGLASVLEPGRHYLEFGDSAELRAQTDDLVRHPERRSDIIQAARAQVEREHSWAVRARKIVDDYQRVMA